VTHVAVIRRALLDKANQFALDEVLEKFFHQKRANFMQDYDLLERPALIWQAWPSAELEVDVSNEQLLKAMQEGGHPESDYGWWYGFRPNGRPALVFDGLASTSRHSDDGWVTEIHVDGHICAGVWSFPKAADSAGSTELGIMDFYEGAHRDFTYLVSKAYEVVGVSGPIHLTATMHRANRIALLSSSRYGTAPVAKRETLRWPILTVNAAEILEAEKAMAAQFLRLYGRKPRD